MMKIAFFCLIIAINYIRCNSIDISNQTDAPILVPIKDVEQMKFLTSLNISEPEVQTDSPIVISNVEQMKFLSSLNISEPEVQTDPPIVISNAEHMKFLTSLNISEPKVQTNQSDIKSSDTSVFYKWLNFLKTSTSTQVNNVTILSK